MLNFAHILREFIEVEKEDMKVVVDHTGCEGVG